MRLGFAFIRRLWGITGSGLVVALLAAGAWGTYSYWKAAPAAAAVSLDPDRVREQMDDPNLTEEQRRELGRQMRAVFEARMDARLDEYFTAGADGQQAVLDRHIDEMQAEMKEREERRQQREPQPGAGEERPRRQRPDFASMTTQERKLRMESRDPDRQARRMAYFAAVRARMEERGMQPPQFGPIGRGGPRP